MAARQWSKEQKLKQSEAIRQWQPWQSSTGATTAVGKAKVSKNAFKGGYRPLVRELSAVLREQKATISSYS